MLLSLLKFEWQLHSRQPVFLLGLLACGVFGGFLCGVSGSGGCVEGLAFKSGLHYLMF